MAKRLAASLALFLFLFLFFAFSHARDISDPFPKPEPNPESAAEIQTEPQTKPQTTLASNSKPQQHDTVPFTVDSVDPVPLTLVSLRPIGRHIPPRHQLPLPLPSSLRFGHRRCRHGRRREISYGNDMIVRASGGGVAAADRMIPARWVSIHHGEPRISEIPRIDRRFDNHEHRHHHHYHHDEEEKHGEGWVVKKIRKFFDLF